jgi:hypothetical protein
MNADDRATVDVDEEHTRLLTYRRAAEAAAERIEELAALLDGLVPVLVLPDGAVDERDGGSMTLVDAIAAASTAEMMKQANFRAALGTLASPVQQSLLAFVG